MYNVVRVAVKKGDSTQRVLGILRHIDLGDDGFYFDEHTNGATFLVSEKSMDTFLSKVNSGINNTPVSVIGTTKCSDGSFLLAIGTKGNGLAAHDDERIRDMWR